MTTHLLRSLVLTTVLALLFQVSGAAPPTDVLTVNPTDTRVEGIDVDATTIPGCST